MIPSSSPDLQFKSSSEKGLIGRGALTITEVGAHGLVLHVDKDGSQEEQHRQAVWYNNSLPQSLQAQTEQLGKWYPAEQLRR